MTIQPGMTTTHKLPQWKPVEVITADTITAQQALAQIHAQIRLNANEAGEFVQQIQIGVGQPHSVGSTKWTAYYLPGPPALYPGMTTETRQSGRDICADTRTDLPGGSVHQDSYRNSQPE